MRRRLPAAALVALVLGAALSIPYWQDPVYWRRWWHLVTHLEPDHMDFSPLASVGGGAVFELPRASAGGLTVDPAALREAEAYAAAFDSYALIVVHWGVVQSEWYAPGWSAQRLTQSQSMAKTVAALMVGAAIAQGDIADVAAPLANWLPEWRGDPRGAIPLRDLLTMTSGLAPPRYSFNPFPADAGLRFLLSSDRSAAYLRTPALRPPGTLFEYNDVNAALAGLIVQRATGMPSPTSSMQRCGVPWVASALPSGSTATARVAWP